MTKIEWCRGDDGSEGLSWNPLRAERVVEREGEMVKVSANHCEHVNEACRFCYAERGNRRLRGLAFKPGHRNDYTFTLDEEKLLMPLRRKKPTRIFVESMSDAFGEWWPTEFIDKIYAVMALCPQHTFINLSKRPERRREYLDDPETAKRVYGHCWSILGTREGSKIKHGGNWRVPFPLPNVIEGTSVSNQREADEFIPILLQTKAALRAVSCEPLLGPIDLTAIRRRHAEGFMRPLDGRFNTLGWVIVGGESGTEARPMHPDWARSLQEQCAAANVPFFFKQWGEWKPGYTGEADIAVFPNGDTRTSKWISDAAKSAETRDHTVARMCRVGKKAAGRLLDGVEHNGFPMRPS